jgi:hypothetical protein
MAGRSNSWTTPVIRPITEQQKTDAANQINQPATNNVTSDTNVSVPNTQYDPYASFQFVPQSQHMTNLLTNMANPPADPVQVATGMTAFGQQQQPVQQQPQTVQQTQQVQPQAASQYSMYDPTMAAQYNNVIGGMLDGSAYDPFEQANKEATVRAERQQRANAADQINRFGALGQGIGSQMANSTESGILENRFAQNLEQAKAREEVKQKGLSAYENSINAENNLTNVDRNKVGLDSDKVALDSDKVSLDRNKVALDSDKTALEQNRFNLEQTKTDTADAISGDFASYIQSSTDLKGATAEQIAADQGAMSKGQAMWESMGGSGAVSADWVKQMTDRVNDPVLNDTFASAMNDAKSYLSQGLINQDEYNTIEQVNKLALTGGITVDENGKIIQKAIENETTEEDKKAEGQELVDEVTSGVYTYQQIKSDPERYKAAKENAITLSKDTTVDKKGRNTRKFNSIPEKNVPFSWNGKTLMRTGDKSTIKNRGKGYDWEQFSAIDIVTGETITIKSNAL